MNDQQKAAIYMRYLFNQEPALADALVTAFPNLDGYRPSADVALCGECSQFHSGEVCPIPTDPRATGRA